MEVIQQLQPIFLIIFVYATMIYLGLGMTVKDIGNAFKRPKILIIALILNVLISPLLAMLLGQAFGLSAGALTAVILVNLLGGAPAGPKNADLAGGDAPLSIALVAVLAIADIAIVPFTSQLFLPDVQIDAIQILSTLLIYIVIPLAAGLLIRQFRPKIIKGLGKVEKMISNIFMILVLFSFIVPNWSNILSVGVTTLLVYLLVIAVTFVVSYALTFGTTQERKTVSLITITKNFGVALSIAALPSFAGQDIVPEMMTYVVVLLVFSLVVSISLKKLGGKKDAPQVSNADK